MDTNSNDKGIKRKQKILEDLGKDEDYSVEKFDTLIVSLSSGGLVFSIGFVKDVIKNFNCIDLFWLKVCWICFSVALIGNLTSQVTGYFSNKHERKAVRFQIKKLKGDTTNTLDSIISKSQKQSDFFDNCTNKLNAVCYFAFITAVATLTYFIYSNV